MLLWITRYRGRHAGFVLVLVVGFVTVSGEGAYCYEEADKDYNNDDDGYEYDAGEYNAHNRSAAKAAAGGLRKFSGESLDVGGIASESSIGDRL